MKRPNNSGDNFLLRTAARKNKTPQVGFATGLLPQSAGPVEDPVISVLARASAFAESGARNGGIVGAERRSMEASGGTFRPTLVSALYKVH